MQDNFEAKLAKLSLLDPKEAIPLLEELREEVAGAKFTLKA